MCGAFQGETVNLCPLGSSTRRFPKQLYGFHKLREIKRAEDRCKVNHLFFSFAYPFPILRFLRNPVFYTATASLDVRKRPPALAQLQKLQRIIVSNDRDAAVLDKWGLKNCVIIPPGVETPIATSAAPPIDRELVLLMASAPWISKQFEAKGVDLLLAATAKLPFLRLILLWRGVLVEELARRVERLGIGKRVEIIDRKVDVGQYLERAHAAVVLAENGGLVRSFPHSLIESLLVGRPVLLSDTIAMADYIKSRRCGVALSALNIEGLTSAIESLMRNYETLARNAALIGRCAFPVKALVENHRRLYAL